MAVVWLAAHHAMWRDEVRALTLALSGDNVLAMLRNMHGDGHPALWYLLLRAGHAIVATPLVLPVMAGLIGTAAAILFLTCAPLGGRWLALILFGRFFLYEYTVMARNYGVSMLALFCMAALWQRGYRGIGQGLLLLLLTNSNVHSVILAGAFLLFWMLEVWESDGLRWTPQWRAWLTSAAIAAIGVLLCVIAIFPPIDDAGTAQSGPTFGAVIHALLLPAWQLRPLFPLELLWRLPGPVWQIGGSLLLFGGLLAFARRPNILAAAAAAMLLLSLMFALVYPASYRHVGLLLVFLVTMLWLDRSSMPAPARSDRFASLDARAQPIGSALLAVLFAIQLIGTVQQLANTLRDRPESRSAYLASWVHQHPEFARSWIIADPDYLIEPIPYYLSNPVWRLREQQPGSVVIFTRHARLSLTLDEILATARELRARSGKPVLILMTTRLDQVASAQINEGFNWVLNVQPDAKNRFLKTTTRVARFAPVSVDETYDVYALP